MILQEYTPSKFFTTAVSFAVHNFKSCESLPWCLQQAKIQPGACNNFPDGAGQVDRPKLFLLGHNPFFKVQVTRQKVALPL